MDNQKIKQLVEMNKAEFYEDLAKVIQIRSVKSRPKPKAPFGEGPKHALEQVMAIAQTYGFHTQIVNDAMGYVQWGEASDYIGIVGHLDVVPEGDIHDWISPPYALVEREGVFYARGILDNKGPIMACLYALKLLKDSGMQPSKTIRIIFGTDEESGSHDVPMYLEKEQPPRFGFTPDCKYPVVYGERGIVNYELTTSFSPEQIAELVSITGDQASDHVPDHIEFQYGETVVIGKGKRSPSNAPELGENALTDLAEQLVMRHILPKDLHEYFVWLNTALKEQHHGEGLNLELRDDASGALMVTPYQLIKEGEALKLSLAIRYPVSFTEEEITERLQQALPKQTKIAIIRSLKSTKIVGHELEIGRLSQVYQEWTGYDATPVTTTGATYARFMPNIVAFGPSFPGQKGIAHNSNEYMTEADLLLNLMIYTQAIATLIE